MKLLFISLLFLAAGCKKSTDPLSNFVNNRISITVTSSSGAVTSHNFTKELAPMGHYFYTGTFYAEGKISSNDRQISFGPTDSDPTKVSCSYYPNGSAGIRYDSPTVNPGTISLTKSGNNHAEGSFNAKCGSGSDTLTIQGTFSGYYNP